MIAAWLRGHWGIENTVHWVRDITFDEDRSTVHTGTAPQVMATLRNTALNLHRLAGADNIAEACRVTAFSADRGLDLLKTPNQQVTSVLINNAGALSDSRPQITNGADDAPAPGSLIVT